MKRKTEVIYYDCANYFFERARENQKENSTIWMELYMDLEGIQLAYTISKEEISKQDDVPYIERTILSELESSDFIICADEEMTSLVYRKFDQKKNKVFMIAQPIRKLQPSVREWALASTGWHVVGEREIYDISVQNSIKDKNKMFYKERLIRENDMEQKLREINFLKIKGEGYVPTYVRNDLTDYLHEVFDLKTDYQIIKLSEMNDIIKSTKYYLSGPL